MPLDVIFNEDDPSPAQRVYWDGVFLNGCRRYDVDVYSYAVADNPNEETALGTSGAGPCQIVIVHKARGQGALGHYGGHPDPYKIVEGVQAMVNQLGGGPIQAVVLAAGLVADGEKQRDYESTIISTVRNSYPEARVLWPTPPQHDVWGAAYYLPLAERVGLLDMSPGGFVGFGDEEHGITVHPYAP